MTAKLEVDKLSYKYGNFEVLKEVSFSVAQGEFIGLIGPNGSGKSTLLKNINSILYPDDGKVYLDNFDLQNLGKKEIAKKLAVVPQNTNVNFDFTVEEIVLMGRAPYIGRFESESDEDYEVVKEAMELTNTLKLAERPISQLSGGERQRVILARSLAQQPEVLLLDEPTSNLDINYQLEIMNLLKKLNRDHNLTVIVVLHDLNLASEYCDKLLLLEDGEIYAHGSPKEIVTAENIEDVYGSKVIIKKHYPSGRPYVTMLDNHYIPETQLDHQVHIICGGGTGRELIENLVEQGFQVSCGVLNEQDSDWEVAKSCDVEIVAEEPFAPISQESHEANLAAIKEVDTVVLTEIPFGSGNLLNLKAAFWAAEQGKEVIVMDQERLSKRDYTKGEGNNLYKKLLDMGVIVVGDNYEVLDKLVKDRE
ncbi:heme ABC transporter ATP-binding protein [Acetohalobium arabaticum]|uniref:ABC transporter related protein n=1 Tax=Acetohalobium arabaticum (strain ATCC 49924 / DSM 5501 / Z-7288) TaxID=574087 RepID=D9QVQ0_ACEAZ|nr:heme ABC transporter ATP-binding protein [Acetohalobium arabaticum]ADL12309.1 ABC transporter related protein [Acetohalobium arabaticum DSM 5501]